MKVCPRCNEEDVRVWKSMVDTIKGGDTCDERRAHEHWLEKHSVCREKATLTADLIEALEDAIEYTKDVLMDHDERLGRSIKKNRDYAEQIESDIRRFTVLKKRLGGEG